MPATLELGQSFPHYPHSFTVSHYMRRRQVMNGLSSFCRLVDPDSLWDSPTYQTALDDCRDDFILTIGHFLSDGIEVMQPCR